MQVTVWDYFCSVNTLDFLTKKIKVKDKALCVKLKRTKS